MNYKGYEAKIEFDTQNEIFHGRVINIADVIEFKGCSVEELKKEFEISIEDYLEACADFGKAPDKPFSGRFVVRVSPCLHRSVTIAAGRENVSLNTWVSQVLEKALPASLLLSEPSEEAEKHDGRVTVRRKVETTVEITATLLGNEIRGEVPGSLVRKSYGGRLTHLPRAEMDIVEAEQVEAA